VFEREKIIEMLMVISIVISGSRIECVRKEQRERERNELLSIWWDRGNGQKRPKGFPSC